MSYYVSHERWPDACRMFNTRREACAYADRMEGIEAGFGGTVRQPWRITYHGREVLRDDVEDAAAVARDSARSAVAWAKKRGKLRTFRGGLVAVR